MNNVTHNLHLNGQTTVAWKTLLYVLVGICLFLAVCQLLCVLSTQSIFMLGLKVFGFTETKAQVK